MARLGETNRSGSARRKSIRSLKDEEDPSEKIEDDILTDELFDIPKDYVEVSNYWHQNYYQENKVVFIQKEICEQYPTYFCFSGQQPISRLVTP